MKEEKLPFENIKRRVLIRREGVTDSRYGKDPFERNVKELIRYGIININKPSGPTSRQVSHYVKTILHVDKAGHAGTLDPNVTGVLPVATGDGTRVVQALLNTGKEYVCHMRLHHEVDPVRLNEVIEKRFSGKIMQLPPKKSAVKRVLRPREVYYFNVYENDGINVLFKIGCEAGTYIRKICDDLGKELGVGAHMMQLVRTRVGMFNDQNWHSLHDLKDAYEFYKEGNESLIRNIIMPMEVAIVHLPKIWVFDNAIDSLCHGAFLARPGICRVESGINRGNLVAVLSLKNELVCLGDAETTSEEMMKDGRGLSVKNCKVFMERGTYPKLRVSD